MGNKGGKLKGSGGAKAQAAAAFMTAGHGDGGQKGGDTATDDPYADDPTSERGRRPRITDECAKQLYSAMEWLEDGHLREKGLYRIPGSRVHVQPLAHHMRSGGKWTARQVEGMSFDDFGAHTVASALKVCLMEHEPLTMYDLWDDLEKSGGG